MKDLYDAVFGNWKSTVAGLAVIILTASLALGKMTIDAYVVAVGLTWGASKVVGKD